MHLNFFLASFNHLAFYFSGIIFPAGCKIIFRVYNLRHKLDYLCKYEIKLDIVRSKQQTKVKCKKPFTSKHLWQQEAVNKTVL